MRAIYFPNLNQINENEIDLSGDHYHHLVHVLRCQLNDKILVLSGVGIQAEGIIAQITKREIKIVLSERINVQRSRHEIDLLLGIPKKDALDLCLKQAVELGVSRIFLYHSKYTQGIVATEERIQSLIVSSLEQSNSPFLPQVIITKDLTELPWGEFHRVFLFDLISKIKTSSPGNNNRTLFMVGPEGGFAPDERDFLVNKATDLIHLPTGILRTPTAVACGAGFVLHELMNNNKYDKL